MSRKIILIKQELLLLVYELNRSGLLAENEKIRDRKSGSAGMPRPISYAVFCLKKKSAHSHRRSVHVPDATGYAIQHPLEAAAANHPNITLLPDMFALALVTCRLAAHVSTSVSTL